MFVGEREENLIRNDPDESELSKINTDFVYLWAGRVEMEP